KAESEQYRSKMAPLRVRGCAASSLEHTKTKSFTAKAQRAQRNAKKKPLGFLCVFAVKLFCNKSTRPRARGSRPRHNIDRRISANRPARKPLKRAEIGRASCRESV